MNLFGAWEVGAPKVGSPSSHETSPGPLFIGSHMASCYDFWVKSERRNIVNIKKKFRKILRKKRGNFEWQKLLQGW